MYVRTCLSLNLPYAGNKISLLKKKKNVNIALLNLYLRLIGRPRHRWLDQVERDVSQLQLSKLLLSAEQGGILWCRMPRYTSGR